MEAQSDRHRKGSLLRVSCPPPSAWEYDEHGRPTWIPLRHNGNWHRLLRRGRITIELPRLEVKAAPHHGHGRPRLSDTRVDLGEIVWRHDLLGDGYRTIAADLHYEGQDPRTTIRYQVRTGRKGLAASGVIPWAAYPNGTLPPNWWTHEAIEALVYRWITETLRTMSLADTILGLIEPTRQPSTVPSPQESS